MQAPTIIFDHVNGSVAIVQPGPVDQKLTELNSAIQNQVTTSTGRPA